MSEQNRPNYSFWALVLTLAAVIIPGFIALKMENQAVFFLKGWALSAVALAAIASAVRLAAHNGDKDFDGFGKMLGFGAACVAFFAAAAGALVSMD